MKVIEHLSKAKETLFSIEILPPQKGKNIDDLFNTIDPLMEFNPAFIDVTYHREELVDRKLSDGSIIRIPLRKRPGTVGICAAIKARFGVDTVPHLICHGFTKEETEDALFSLYYLGIDNVLLLKGDEKPCDKDKLKTGNQYASDLIDQVARMNKGEFLYEETYKDMSTDFCIGTAGYPEKHFEAPNLHTDLSYLKRKVDLGADYIVTQLFFDNQKFFDFVGKCRDIGINVPIIPGIKPLTTKRHLSILPAMFHIDIPVDLSKAVLACKTPQDVHDVGVEWAIAQSKELKEAGVPCIHYYTMSRNKATISIAKEVF